MSIASRVEDIHEAFLDPNVKMVITCLGGFNANQLLRYLDYDLIAKHPKIFCGYSDITALSNAIYARTGLVTYHGPHFSTFGFDKEIEFTRYAFVNCIMNDKAIFIVLSILYTENFDYTTNGDTKSPFASIPCGVNSQIPKWLICSVWEFIAVFGVDFWDQFPNFQRF